MADLTIYNESGLLVDVVTGPPPPDQSAEVERLTQENESLKQQVTALQAKIDAALAALK